MIVVCVYVCVCVYFSSTISLLLCIQLKISSVLHSVALLVLSFVIDIFYNFFFFFYFLSKHLLSLFNSFSHRFISKYSEIIWNFNFIVSSCEIHCFLLFPLLLLYFYCCFKVFIVIAIVVIVAILVIVFVLEFYVYRICLIACVDLILIWFPSLCDDLKTFLHVILTSVLWKLNSFNVSW